jgi:formate hydrogenlyase transcriptional activator
MSYAMAPGSTAFVYPQPADVTAGPLAEPSCFAHTDRANHAFAAIIGASAALRRALTQIELVAPTRSTVLIQGETGTGKELFAKAIHQLSPRRHRPLVKFNCAAIPAGLLEAELFGHERGAFTGAVGRKQGRFELAHAGTLFLDEIGELPLELQPKLLRVLQEQEFERLGGTRTIKADFRLVVATNRELAQMVDEGAFRADLYYRLNIFPVRVPPLRERREDIPLLVRHFVEKFARPLNKRIETVAAATLEALARHHWPGNVRELQNLIERAVILAQDGVLPLPLDSAPAPQSQSGRPKTLKEVERDHILLTLQQTGWVIGGPNGAAARLGVKRTTLLSKMEKLGISRQLYAPRPDGQRARCAHG